MCDIYEQPYLCATVCVWRLRMTFMFEVVYVLFICDIVQHLWEILG